MRVGQYVCDFLNFPAVNWKACVKKHLSVDSIQILNKLRHLVRVYQSLIADNHVNYGENGKKVNFVCSSSIIFLREKTITQTKARLYNTMGTCTISFNGNKWFTGFHCSRTSTRDAEHSECQVEVATPKTIEKIHDMVFTNQRLKVREIVEVIGISHGSVVLILNDHSGTRKQSARWVPCLLTIVHKQNRVTTSKECLELFNCNMDEFFSLFHNRGQNMDSPQHTRNQAAVET